MKLFYMDMARRAAQLSYAERKKVGAVARTPQDIIVYSWNGRPAGDPNHCEIVVGYNLHADEYTLETHPDVLHAESNLVAKAAREGVSLKDKEASRRDKIPLRECIEINSFSLDHFYLLSQTIFSLIVVNVSIKL